MHLKHASRRTTLEPVTLTDLRPDLGAGRHDGYRHGERGHRQISAALFAAGVATFALLYSTQALLPEFTSSFGVGADGATWSLSLTTIGLGVTLLFAGSLSELVGRTRLIHWSVLTSSLVGLLCALAPTWSALLGLRLVQGILLAGMPAVAMAYLREELHPSTHARAAGLYIGGNALGGMAGRLLTGAIGEVAGWRWALASVALLGVCCAVVVRITLPDSRNFERAAHSARGLLAGLAAALREPGLLALYGIGACAMGAFVAVYNSLGFRLTDAPFDLSLGAAGLVFLVYPIGSLSSALAGRLTESLGRRGVVPLGCVVTIAGAVITLSDNLLLVVVGLAVMTAGFFAVHGVASGWVPGRAHAAGVPAGQAASCYLLAYYAGSSVFGTLSGAAWSGRGWGGVVALAGGLTVAAILLAAYLWRTPSLVPGLR